MRKQSNNIILPRLQLQLVRLGNGQEDEHTTRHKGDQRRDHIRPIDFNVLYPLFLLACSCQIAIRAHPAAQGGGGARKGGVEIVALVHDLGGGRLGETLLSGTRPDEFGSQGGGEEFVVDVVCHGADSGGGDIEDEAFVFEGGDVVEVVAWDSDLEVVSGHVDAAGGAGAAGVDEGVVVVAFVGGKGCSVAAPVADGLGRGHDALGPGAEGSFVEDVVRDGGAEGLCAVVQGAFTCCYGSLVPVCSTLLEGWVGLDNTHGCDEGAHILEAQGFAGI